MAFGDAKTNINRREFYRETGILWIAMVLLISATSRERWYFWVFFGASLVQVVLHLIKSRKGA